ncbi:MAG: 3-isopropylmalate dehydratase large subunit [Burkholderiales bacterium]|nr:3-isopropylmalate dehydratase large subunit [Burkholderiales bacterium]
MATAASLFDKIWDEHVVARLDGGEVLLHIDRHVLNDLTSPQAFSGLEHARRKLRNPALTFAVTDHMLSTEPGRGDDTVPGGAELIRALRASARRWSIDHFDVGDARQGIVHVVSPELGIALPGTTLVCGDSHTCTIGALGAIAFGIGTSEVEHVLATQTVIMRKPRTMRIVVDGALGPGVSAKDVVLFVIARLGTAAASGHAVEFAGSTIRGLDMEARMTVCNMSIEMGGRIGMIAPDATTFDYLAGRPYAPAGAAWQVALTHWNTLPSAPDARFDVEHRFEAGAIAPQITWGTNPSQATAVDQCVPDPGAAPSGALREQMQRALAYMGLTPGRPLAGVPIDRVFIGSCTNSRLSDLRAAAAVARGRKVAPGVKAMVVPGSAQVKRAAEAEGLDEVFRAAGFDWREPGCSMCCGLNADKVAPRERCVATSNRNFEGRQGPLARTHLASPAMAAAAAIAGSIADVRQLAG